MRFFLRNINGISPIETRKLHLLWKKGIGTLEVVIIIAVLLSVALIFRQALTAYAAQLIQSVFGDQSAISDLFIDGGS